MNYFTSLLNFFIKLDLLYGPVFFRVPKDGKFSSSATAPICWNRGRLTLIWVSESLALCWLLYLHSLAARVFISRGVPLPKSFYVGFVAPDVLLALSIFYEIYHYLRQTLTSAAFYNLQLAKVIETGLFAAVPFILVVISPFVGSELRLWWSEHIENKWGLSALIFCQSVLFFAPFLNAWQYANGVQEQFRHEMRAALDRCLESSRRLESDDENEKI